VVFSLHAGSRLVRMVMLCVHALCGSIPEDIFFQCSLRRELAARRRSITGGQGLLPAYHEPDAMRDSAAEALLAVTVSVATE
jgi:hypothetical protein